MSLMDDLRTLANTVNDLLPAGYTFFPGSWQIVGPAGTLNVNRSLTAAPEIIAFFNASAAAEPDVPPAEVPEDFDPNVLTGGGGDPGETSGDFAFASEAPPPPQDCPAGQVWWQAGEKCVDQDVPTIAPTATAFPGQGPAPDLSELFDRISSLFKGGTAADGSGGFDLSKVPKEVLIGGAILGAFILFR